VTAKLAFLTFDERNDYYLSRILQDEAKLAYIQKRFGVARVRSALGTIDDIRANMDVHWIIDYPILHKLKQMAQFVVALWIPFILGIVGMFTVDRKMLLSIHRDLLSLTSPKGAIIR
jgi:hypothetical protein